MTPGEVPRWPISAVAYLLTVASDTVWIEPVPESDSKMVKSCRISIWLWIHSYTPLGVGHLWIPAMMWLEGVQGDMSHPHIWFRRKITLKWIGAKLPERTGLCLETVWMKRVWRYGSTYGANIYIYIYVYIYICIYIYVIYIDKPL